MRPGVNSGRVVPRIQLQNHGSICRTSVHPRAAEIRFDADLRDTHLALLQGRRRLSK